MDIVYKKISELVPYENNPRKNDGAVEAVANSIERFGFKVPLVIDKDNVVVAGHTRLKASKKLGLKEVPCIVADDLTDEQVKAFRIADNSTAEIAEWDFEKLDAELKELSLEMDGLGLEELDIKLDNGEVEEDDFDFEQEMPAICKLGDIWQLGRHRLMCGDSTDSEPVAKLMNGNKADLVFTDPPYGMKKEKEGVLNDNLNYDELLEFNKKWIPLTFGALKDNGSWYCWGIDEPLMDIYSEILKPKMRRKEIAFRNLITWHKNPSGCGDGQNNSLARKYGVITEKCLFVMRGSDSVQGFTVNTEDYNDNLDSIRLYLKDEADKVGIMGNKQVKEITGVGMYSHWFTKSQFALMTRENYEKLQAYAKGRAFTKEYDELKKEYDELKKEYDELKKEFYEGRAYFDNTHDLMTEVWKFNRANKTERAETGGHATPKPIALCSRAIKSSSREGEIVLDLFGGSGSTLIACEQLDRICYMMELDPKYCDVIIKRWETLTGGKAVLVNG